MSRSPQGEVLVLGGGLVGLACARALAEYGEQVVLVSARTPGEASSAAAGMLAPSVERSGDSAHRFALLARDRCSELAATLTENTGIPIAVNRLGILEVAQDDSSAQRLAAQSSGPAEWLDPSRLRAAEPALAASAGALLHTGDGSIDNVSLLHALRCDVERRSEVRVMYARARRISLAAFGAQVEVDTGEKLTGRCAVLAMGAWTPRLAGLPRPIPIEPVRGQLVCLGAAPLRHVCYGEDHYLVPRAGRSTLVGSTMERVGYRPGTTDAAAEALTQSAYRLVPALRETREVARWSGLRPVTPDLLPIIGADPEHPPLLYACGHSRNGVLMAALTGDVIARLARGAEPGMDLAAFSVERFERQLTC